MTAPGRPARCRFRSGSLSGIRLLDPGDIAVDDERVVRVVYHKSRLSAVWLFHMFLFHIVDLYFFTSPLTGIIGGEPAGFLKSRIRELCSAGFYDHMGAGGFFGVKPPVVSRGEAESQIFVLQVVFSYIDMKSVAGDVVEGLAFGLPLLFAGSLPDVSGAGQFVFDLSQVVFREST